METTPCLLTERLLLRRFTEEDVEALFEILSDEEVNTFLPWFPLKSLQAARDFLRQRYLNLYEAGHGYHYAVCLKCDNRPIGYLNVSDDDSHDFGYGLKKEFWRKGITTEAGRAVLERLKTDGLPFVTATHDVLNPRSGDVMKKLGMTYQYSYEEQWQPKNKPVIFRLYQLSLDGQSRPAYAKYWEQSARHFIEELA